MKRWIGCILRGALMGVGLQQLVAISVSAWLHLGYYMACITTLPEMAGGEIRAVVLQTAVSGLAGAGIALALELWRQHRWSLRRRVLTSGAAILTVALPAALLCLCATYGLS